jgi:hypothetical protein
MIGRPGLRLALVCAAVASLVAAGVARAATLVDFTGQVGPAIRTVPKKPLALSLRITLRLSSDQPGGLPATLDRTTISFPYGSQLNSRLFPSCNVDRLNRRGVSACPRASRVGTGFAVGVGDTVRQRLTVTLFNGPRGRTVIFYLRGTNPLRVNIGFTAPLRTLRGGRYQYSLQVDVPRSLQVIAGVPIALQEFQTTLKASRRVGGRKRSYLEGYSCPPGAQVPLRGTFSFLEGPSLTRDSWITCG